MQVFIEMIKDIQSATNWIFSSILDPLEGKPLQGLKDIHEFFKSLISGFRILGKMIAKDWRKGLANFFGGLFFIAYHHQTEFTAQLVLVLSAGFKVIDILDGCIKETVTMFGAAEETANSVKRLSNTVLIILHMIDDPLIILSAVSPAVNAVNSEEFKEKLVDSKYAQKFVYQNILGLNSTDENSVKSFSKEEFKTSYSSFISFICTNTTQKVTFNGETIDYTTECKTQTNQL